jgi:hypothetical protein
MWIIKTLSRKTKGKKTNKKSKKGSATVAPTPGGDTLSSMPG